MFKKISYFIIFISLFFISNVSAATYKDSFNEHYMWIPNEYISKKKDNSVKYQQMSMMVRKSDNSFVYCIEPGKSLNESTIFTGYDSFFDEHAKLTNSQLNRIKLLAYFGYGYKDHTDIKWYVITQYMIWQTNNLGYDIYFTDTLNGNKITKYVDEMLELEEMVNTYTKTPIFNTLNLNVFAKSEKSFVDNNNVLDRYTLSSSNNVEVSKDNNILNVKLNNSENGYVIFTKSEKRFNRKMVVYTDDESQDLLLPGDLSNVYDRKEIIPKFGSVSLIKKDYDSKKNVAQGYATLENALYGLYDESNNLLEKKYTDKNGKIVFDSKLPLGNYLIKEIEPSIGYELDKNIYNFTATENDSKKEITVYEHVIKKEIELTKYLDISIDKLEFEPDIIFDIYDDNNNFIKSVKTNSNGKVIFELPYGKYNVVQQNTTYGFSKVDDFKIDVSDNNKLFLNLKNTKLKYNLKVNIMEKNSLEKLNDIGVTFDTNSKNIFKKTDNYGQIYYDEDLDYGNYKLNINNTNNYFLENKNIDLILDENTNYYILGDKRVVEIDIFLDKEKNENINDEKNEVVKKEEETKKIIEIVNDESSDYAESFKEEVSNEEIVVNDDYIIFPNTYKNDYKILFIIFGLAIVIKKIAL